MAGKTHSTASQDEVLLTIVIVFAGYGLLGVMVAA